MKEKRLNKIEKDILNYHYDKLFDLEDERRDLRADLDDVNHDIILLKIRIQEIKTHGVPIKNE